MRTSATAISSSCSSERRHRVSRTRTIGMRHLWRGPVRRASRFVSVLVLVHVFAGTGTARSALAQSTAPAGPTARTTGNTVSWFSYDGDHALGGRLSLYVDAWVRRADGIRTWQQLESAQGLTYRAHRRLGLTAGYTFVRTYPYGADPVPRPEPEHRGWVQAELRHPVGPLAFAHRTRAERRWVGHTEPRPGAPPGFDWRLNTGLRQQLSVTVPLPFGRGDAAEAGDAPFYLNPVAELFVRVAPARAGAYIEQTRETLALGYRAGRTTRVELGYLHQFTRDPGARERERNHALLVQLRSGAPFQR